MIFNYRIIMTVYGTKIKSDITFLLNLSHKTETRYELELSSKVPSPFYGSGR